MSDSDSDFFVILVLWLVYVAIHLCMDWCERRARRIEAAAEAEEHASLRAAVRYHSGPREDRGEHREIHVVVLGAESDATVLAATVNCEPCEGALVPDASGRVPQLPEPVQYGEASYAPRREEGDVTKEVDVNTT